MSIWGEDDGPINFFDDAGEGDILDGDEGGDVEVIFINSWPTDMNLVLFNKKQSKGAFTNNKGTK